MTPAAIFWHSGGHVLCASGPVTLRRARDVAGFCTSCESAALHDNRPRRAQVFQVNGRALTQAVLAAEAWRLAAGWSNPDDADALEQTPFRRTRLNGDDLL